MRPPAVRGMRSPHASCKVAILEVTGDAVRAPLMSGSDPSQRGKRIQTRCVAAVRRRIPVLIAMTVVLVLGGVTGYVVAAPQDQSDVNVVDGPSGTSGATNLGPVSIFPNDVMTFSLQYKVVDGSQSNASGSVLISGPGVNVQASGIRRTYAKGCPGAKNSSQLKIVACGFTHDIEYPSLYVLNVRVQSSSNLRGTPTLGSATLTLRTVRLKVTGPSIGSSGYDPDCLGNIDPSTGGCTTTPSSTTSTTTTTTTTGTSTTSTS
jgi:hypothetical protein